MEALVELISRIEPHALVLALALPPVIRAVGHWIPEELFMVAMGVLAARSPTPAAAAAILGAVLLSHFATDQLVYLGGRWLRPRLNRFPRIESRLERVTERLEATPSAIIGLVPARVLPLGRGAWLAGCGIVRVPWPRFAGVDLTALVVHLAVWSGLGWWLSGDLSMLAESAEHGRVIGLWTAVALVLAATAVLVWRWRERVQHQVPWTHRAGDASVRRGGRTRF